MIGVGIDDFNTPQEIRNQHPKVENDEESTKKKAKDTKKAGIVNL